MLIKRHFSKHFQHQNLILNDSTFLNKTMFKPTINIMFKKICFLSTKKLLDVYIL